MRTWTGSDHETPRFGPGVMMNETPGPWEGGGYFARGRDVTHL